MPPPQPTVWSPDPHTLAKHQMLREYLMAWFPILANGMYRRGLTYVDAFAGPGEYDDGSPGSPIIALRQAYRPDVLRSGSPIRMVFIEKRPDRCQNLERVVEDTFPAARRPRQHKIRIVCDSCEEKLLPALRDVGAEEGALFVNFDGWGVDTPYKLIRQIGRQQSAEVLVTFQTQFFIRFASLEDVEAGDRVFGDSSWRDLAREGTPAEKKARLVDHYLARLAAAGFPFHLTFELIDEGGHELLLAFGTENEKGVERMKEAMWKVDQVEGQRFRDPRDASQMALDFSDGPDLRLLELQLEERVVTHGRQRLSDLKRYALLETMFKPPHAVEAVRRLEELDRVSVPAWRKKHEDTWVEPAPLTLPFG